MSRRLFDHDPDTGTTTWFEDTDEGFNLITEQDLAPILDRNKSLAADKSHWKAGGDWRLEASIPSIILLKWATEDGIPPDMVFSDEYAKKLVRRLNDPDYRHFKTADVRI